MRTAVEDPGTMNVINTLNDYFGDTRWSWMFPVCHLCTVSIHPSDLIEFIWCSSLRPHGEDPIFDWILFCRTLYHVLFISKNVGSSSRCLRR